MKKLIKLLFISLLITGCVYQEKQQKLIKTNILKQQEIAYISNQREIKNETETVTNQEHVSFTSILRNTFKSTKVDALRVKVMENLTGILDEKTRKT